MRSRRGKVSSADLRANPFVVLSDMTIALTFFFAVLSIAASLASSQELVRRKRTENQNVTRDRIIEAFKSRYPNLEAVTRSETDADGARSEFTDFLKKMPNGQRESIGKIQINSNLQRVMVYPPGVFSPGGTDLSSEGRSLYRAIAREIRPDADRLSYLFVHGIAQPTEVTAGSGEPLSRERADVVRRLLEDEGLIRVVGRSASSPLPSVPPQFAISYGTGTLLYKLPGARAGRVDLVLFYKDEVAPRSR